MGSWNLTCALSNLPIVENDEVVLFFVGQSSLMNIRNVEKINEHNINNEILKKMRLSRFYLPYSFALQGIYDDYGLIKNIKTSAFNEKKVLGIDLENKYAKIEDIVQAIREGVEVKSHDIVYYIAMHKEVYYEVLSNMKNRKDYLGETKENEIREELRKHGKREYESVLEQAKNRDLDVDTVFKFRLLSLCLDLCYRYNLDYSFSEILESYIINKEEELEDSLVDLIIFNEAFSMLRKSWNPRCNEGDDRKTYDLHKVVAKYVLEKEEKQYE